MKRQITTLLLTVFTALSFCAGAHAADAIGGGSIRMTLTGDEEALGLRYTTEDDQVDTEIKPSEVLHLSSYDISMDLLWPTTNAFTMVKNGNNLIINVPGDPDDKLVRLNLEDEGVQAELYLPSDVEIGVAVPSKVEILDENDEVIGEVTDEVKEYTSNLGMPIRFAFVPAEAQPDANDGGQDDDGLQGADDLAGDPAPASGGCTLVSTDGGATFHGLWLLAGAALAAARRFRMKK